MVTATLMVYSYLSETASPLGLIRVLAPPRYILFCVEEYQLFCVEEYQMASRMLSE
jgi:hypothetical protein